MNITITRLELLNFKGIRELRIDFDNCTNISGDNGTGKTTVADAFFWVLFGKNSEDRSDFGIKTFDSEGVVIPKIDHEVALHLGIDGNTTIFKRVLRERWVKRRGTAEVVFDGNETICSIDDVPLSVGEYQEKVNTIIDEDVFRMITNPMRFNQLGWEDRRKVLMEIVGGIDDKEIINSKEEFKFLLDIVSKKSLTEYKREIASKKRNINDQLKLIPARIDEVDRNMPESENWDEIIKEIERLNKEVESITSQVSDRSKAWDKANETYRKEQNAIHSLERKQQEIVNKEKRRREDEAYKANSEYRKLQREYIEKEYELTAAKERLERDKGTLESLSKGRETLLGKWHRENEKQFVFDESAFTCPTCERPFEDQDIDAKREELREKFNINKVKTLNSISEEGKAVAERIAATESKVKQSTLDVSSLSALIVELNGKIENGKEVKADLEFDPLDLKEYADLEKEIVTLKEKQSKPSAVDIKELESKREELLESLNLLQKRLSNKEHIDNLNNRKKSLLSEQKTQAQALADLEKEEALISEFTKTKITMVEQRVNDKFNYVKFRMFDTLINGGEVECCDTLINGVPFPDANSAAKLNAGIDIINVLCDHYGVSAPIFIDNRESVNTLIDTRSQVINLIVTKDKELVIN